MKRGYVFGFPRAALGVLRDAVVRNVVTLVVSFVLAGSSWAAFLPTAPQPLGRPAGLLLGFFATGTLLAVLFDLHQRFGLRVVPQFERQLREPPGTYFGGRSLVWRMETLDRLARSGAAVPLSDFGISRDSATLASTWFDPAAGRHTVRVLADAATHYRWHYAVAKDLGPIDSALARAEAEGVRFRLVVVADRGMNARFWHHLRETGF
jgi:hypothetical protein